MAFSELIVNKLKMAPPKQFEKRGAAHMNMKLNHSNLYKEASRIVREVNEHHGHAQNLIYNSPTYLNKRALMAIVMTTLRLQSKIDEVIIKEKLLNDCSDENRARIWVCQIWTAKDHIINDEEFSLVLQKSTNWKKIFDEDCTIDTELPALLPKYLRINTILYSVDKSIQELRKMSCKQIFYDENLSYKEYLKMVESLKKDEFLVDFHFSEVLVFCPNQPLYRYPLVQNGFAFISDKASHIPVHLLSPPPGSSVIDACAAPGMKTLHIAALMENKGCLVAYDYTQQRFELLKKHIALGGATCCKAQLFDFLHVNTSLKSYENVEYILVDPSCSGSGMVKRINKDDNEVSSKRLAAISSSQKALLKRALQFPNVKRVVYSTCSVFDEENEGVVEEVLSCFPGAYEVVDAFPEWPERGSPAYEFGLRCVKTNKDHLTNGFFVAVIQRVKWVAQNVPVLFTKKIRNELKKSNQKFSKRKFVDEVPVGNVVAKQKRPKKTRKDKLSSFEVTSFKTKTADQPVSDKKLARLKSKRRKKMRSRVPIPVTM